jgi:ectoine hydroxylase-related dioxygenase (phytanoyl-CoA dioxygenase family)
MCSATGPDGLPLDDADELNGGLTFAVGSHKFGHLGIRAFLDNDLEAQRQSIQQAIGRLPEFTIRLRAGGVSFHHCLTLHSSGGNSSTGPRRAISIHMMAEGTRYRPGTSCDDHPNVLLLRRRSGALFEGQNSP